MSVRTWLAFTLTELVLSMTPGPAVLLVVSQGMRFGSRPSRRGALGVVAANACYFALSAAGLGAILLASSTLFAVVKWAGVAYLCRVGLLMIVRRPAPTETHASTRVRERPGGHRLFLQGMVVQLSSPKALVFFTALLPQFVSPEGSLMPQFVLLGVSSIAVELPVLVAYGWLAERGRRLLPRSRLSTLPDRLSGVLLVGTGVRIATVRRP